MFLLKFSVGLFVTLFERNKAQIEKATTALYWQKANWESGCKLSRDEVILYFIDRDAESFAKEVDKQNRIYLTVNYEK